MSLTLHSLLGSFGVLLIIVSYFLLMLGKVSSDTLGYPVANAVGAVLIIFSLTADFNLPALLIEVFWLAISMVGIVKSLLARRRRSTARD